MFSVRIVNSDFYTATPIQGIDICSSKFRETTIDKVPVIRIYGATPVGQKTCLHVHGVFPYIYVPYDGTQPTDKYLKQLAVSVDFALQVALGKASSSRQHVYEISVVKGIPFYGYHEGEQEFLRISLYSPFLVTRVVSLLQSGGVMNKVFQPYEAHIPYLLQFFMDYNLYGMNLLHASAVKFRNPVRLDKNGVAESVTVTQKSDSLEPSLKSFVGPSHQIWNKDTVPRECILGSDVERLSFCELEVDVLASDILNKLEIGANIGSNPGLAAIWEDEKQRRRDANESSQISGPSSQDRGLIQLTETEKQFKDRIKEIVDERDLLIQSQIGKLGWDSLSPQEIAALQDSICSLAASQRQSITDESLDADSVSQLLSQHAEALLGEKSKAESSQMVINEDEPVINQGIIEESQRSFSQELSTSIDKEMIDILASLAEDDPVSQRSALSQSIVLDQGDPLINEEHKDEQELSESEESIMMSQRVWDDIEDHSLESGEKQMVDERDTHMASQRVSGYNLEGMSDTWNESFLGENIPQLDGAADEHADGQEVVKNPERKTGKGQAKQESSELDKTKKIHGTSTRIPVNSTKIRDKESVRNATTSNCGYALSRDDTETWGEMIWPGKPRALRTYSKRMSALRSTKSSELHVENNTKAKNDEKAAPSVTSEDAKHQDNELPAFSLFLSESSDSEGSILEEAHVGNERFEVKQRRKNVVLKDNTRRTEHSSVQENSNKIERNLPSDGREILSTEHEDLVNEKKICFEINDAVARIDNTIEDDLTSEKMDGIASRELLGSDGENSAKGRINFAVEKNSSFQSCIPARTKLYSSPDKNAKNTKTRLHTSKQSLSRFREESCPLLIRDVVELTSEISPHCSKDKGTHTRRFTLRKRKWSAIDKEDEEPSQEQKTDIAASLSVVRGAMPNLKVLLEDVAQNSLMDLKLNEARSRLRKKREALHQNFTHLVEKTSNSSARTQTQKQKRLSLRPRELKKSPLSKSTSPKRMEERVKKYGTLPVLIIKSPRKTESTYDSQLSENASGNQLHQAETTVVTSKRPCVRMGSPDNECASSQNWNRGGKNFVGPRGRTETTKIYDVHTSGNEATALSKSDCESKDKSSKNEARRSLSLQRRGLKRKLSVKIEKGSQLTLAGVSRGANKKRKLSLKLEGNSSHTFLRKRNIDDALEDPSEKEKSLRFDNDFDTKPCNSPQVEVNVCSVDRRTKVGIRELDSNKGRLHDITCVPSSPREHDSSEDSPTNGTQPNSHHVAAKVSFAVCKSRKSSELSLPEVNIRDKSDNLSSELHCVLDQRFPEEKETELLANALFNMSFPSPLPCKEECSSPPDPSTPPLATTCDVQDLRDQQPNNLDEISNLESSLVGQIYAQDLVDSLISSSRTSSKIQPREAVDDCLSSKNTSATQGFSSLGILCPQIGETLIQFESMDIESQDKPNWQHETTGDKVSFGLSKNLESKRITQLVANKEVVALERSTNDENTHVVSNLEFPVSKSKSCGSVSIHDSNGAMESSAAHITDLGSVTTQSNVTIGVDSTKCRKTGEVNSCDSENTDFVLKLTAEDDSFADAQEPANKSVFRKTKSSLSEGNHIQPCEEDKSLKSSQLPVKNQSNVCHVVSSLDECNDIQQYNLSSEVVDTGINNGPAPKPANAIKEQTSITHGKENCRNFTACSNPVIGGDVAIKPLKQAPSSDELISTLQEYGLPRCKYQAPFCSDPDDIPASPREVGGRILRIESKEVSNLPDFESLNSLQGLQHWRIVMSSAQECGIQDIYHAMGDASNIHKNIELKIALMGDGDVVVTPCRDPPAPEAVKAWARNKLLKLNLKGNTEEEKDSAPKTLTNAQESSKHESLKGLRTEQDSEKTAVNTTVSKKNRAMEVEKAISLTSDSSIPSKQANKKLSIPPVDTTLEIFADIEREKVGNVMELSNSSSSSVEVTSPYSLFSPNEVKIFSFAPGKQTDVTRRNLDQGEISSTQPMYCGYHDIQMEPKEKVTSGSSPVTDTPLKPQFCEHFPSTTKSPLLQTQSPVFPVPFHSTPVATKLVYGAQSPRCTPISNAATQSLKRLDTNVGKSALMKNSGVKASSAQGPPLRQRLSQFKFVSPGVQPRRSLPWSSQIEGPSPNNTYGFKVTQVNLQDAKALHEVQHLTLFSLELHVRTRRDARPDPEFDPICAIFYFIQTDTPQPNGKNKITGVICVDSESTNVAPSGIENQENSVCNTENVTRKPPYEDAVASTSTSNLSMSRTLQKTRTSHCRSLLCRTGVTDYDVEYVAEEKQLFPALLEIIRKWDPDILIGYEVQMFSWGFLLERALTFELDLCTHLSRVKGSSSSSNMDAEKDQWGASHSSEIKIAGRIILNVWRLMRHEVTLNSYSFENVAFHVLHERIPLFSFRTLSDWWDHKTSLNRWRTVDHYVRRCRGNVRVLESVDFIGRTSELARLFGILFYSVISRGSQYRVESMMLRIAKPMNYIPVSPSVEQRGAMRAPEVIPLVMEPESRFYSDPVLVLDFQSLYPTMIIAYNYCFSTCLGRVSCLPEYGEFKFGATSLCVPPSLLKKLQGDIHISPNGVAFVKPSVRKGILPSMLNEILQTRIMVKTSMKKWKADKSLGRMLDARQLGLKLIANVTFGYTSAHFSGRMPCVEIGDSIVRKARETLERAIDLVNNTPRWGARVVYGDTDSLFVLLKGATKEQAFSIGKDIVDTVTAMNPKPVKLKFEKVYLPCVLQTKKRYVGYMYETLEQKEPVFDAKGIETVRRDSCPAVAKILEKSLRCLFETRDLSLVKKYVQRQCSKLMEGRASLQDFTFAKEYRGMKNYKPGACVPALELTRRMLREDRRSEPRVGERVPYVVVYGSPGLPLIQLVRRPHEVLQDPGLRLNASYYITKQILPPLNRVFSLIGLDVSSWYAELPRVVRVAQMPSDVGNRKKGTISQYFSTLTCPVCQELTHSDLCAKCRAKPQESAVTLISRMRGWERTHQHLAEICYSCCGSRDKLSCVSLDCPVFYKLVQCTRDVKSSLHLRTILESF